MRTINYYREYEVVLERCKKQRHIDNFSILGKTYGLFYGATQDGICGVGGLLKLNEEDMFSLKLNCVCGTNTIVELLALWCLVKFASMLGIDTLHSFGDFIVIINQEKKIWPLQVISLDQWCFRI